MEELRIEIEKELSRSRAQSTAGLSRTLKLIAEGRIIAYKNVLKMMDSLTEL